MSDQKFTRREATQRFFLASAAILAPSWLTACGKKELSCKEAPGLTPEETTMRNVTLAYVDASPDPAKKCSSCQLYKPAGPEACGGCNILKGPINPNGTCKSFAPKAT
jgi:hypothetical protein